MTTLDALLVIAGFVLGCLPLLEWRMERRLPPYRRSSHRLISQSPWI